MVAKKTAGTAVAQRKDKPVANLTDLDLQLVADSGAGFEEASRDAFAIPFFTVLQDLSPQTKKKMAGYVDGAKPGMFFNSVSQKVYDPAAGVWVVPCHWAQVFIEWVPRNRGGGFVGAYPANHHRVAEGIRQKGAGLVLPNGNELMDTRQHFILVLDPDTQVAEGCLMAFKSTGLKISRRWMTQMRSALIEINGRMVEPSMFAWQYLLGVEESANEQGSWWQVTIQDKRRVTDLALYNQAKAFGQAMKTGAAKVNYEDMAPGTGDGGGSDRAPADLDDDALAD